MPPPKPTRRAIIGWGLAAGAGMAGFLPRPADAAEPDLPALASARGIAFGSMAEPRSVIADPASAALIARQSAIVANAQFHWLPTTKSPGAEDLSRAETIQSWAETRRLAVRGHAMLWHLQTPEWWAARTDRGAARREMLDHVTALARRFAGRIASWDVVNEMIRADDGQPMGLRDGPFVRLVGPDYVALALEAAHAADPRARLAINDYGMEADNAGARAKRRAFLSLLDGLKARGAPITSVGLQSHLTAGLPDFSEASFRAFLRELAARDVSIVLSELDVVDRPAPADEGLRNRMVADSIRRYLDVAFDEPRVGTLIVWGITDRYNWVADLSLPAHRRDDGARPRPSLYDRDLRPKPAVEAVAAALRAAPSRPPGGT